MRVAFLFPGQGSQAVGMGKSLAEAFPAARRVFDEVDEALGEKLSALMFDGPEAELTLTANAQPALMAMSLAALRVLEAEEGIVLERDCAFVAGHSLGEYAALAAASALDIADTARLLRIRGLAMQKSVPVGAGAMAALIGCEWELAAKIAAEAQHHEVCEIANDNGGGQIVLSGAKAAVERACDIARARGVKRAVMLQVSAPFHCSLMQPAATAMAEALAHTTIRPPRVPVITNVSAGPVVEPDAIRTQLVEQVTGTVRWRESMAFLGMSGITRFVELGAGKVLSGLVKRVVEGASTVAVGTPEDLVAFRLFNS